MIMTTHKTAGAINYFGGLKEKVCKEIQEFLVVVKMLCEENLANDVGSCFVKQQVRIHFFTCKMKGAITFGGKLQASLPFEIQSPKYLEAKR